MMLEETHHPKKLKSNSSQVDFYLAEFAIDYSKIILSSPAVLSWRGLCDKKTVKKASLRKHPEVVQGITTSRYATLLRECGNSKALADGQRIHSDIVSHGYQKLTFLSNLLVEMYGKCGDLVTAQAVFEKIDDRNIFSWTILLSAYAQNGYPTEALGIFRRMNNEGLKSDNVVFISVIRACSSLRDLTEGSLVHAQILTNGIELVGALLNAVIIMYGKCGKPTIARELFEKSGKKDDVRIWNAMIGVYVQFENMQEALNLYREMQRSSVKADLFTFRMLVDVCSSTGAVADGREIHKHLAASGFERDNVLAHLLVTLYGKCGLVNEARQVFEQMRSNNVDSWLWNAMISAYRREGNGRYVILLYREMLLEGVKPDCVTFLGLIGACTDDGCLGLGKIIHQQLKESGMQKLTTVGNALINMYGKCQFVADARKTFDEINKSVVSWNIMLATYAHCGHSQEAFQLYREMNLEGFKSDEVTFIAVLDLCSNVETLLDIHARVVASGFGSHLVVGTELIKMYGKCGRVADARDIFDHLKLRNTVCLTALITAYLQNGYSKEALEVYNRTPIKADTVTFASLIQACTQLGSLDDGREIHSQIIKERIEIDEVLGSSLIAMYGKCGSLEDANKAFDDAACRNVFTWNSLVLAYANNGHLSDALTIWESMSLEGISHDEVSLIILLFLCSQAGLVERGRQEFVSMRSDYGIVPTIDHYACMVDVLGRAGQVMYAKELMEYMPFRPDYVSWITFMGACSIHSNVESGTSAAKQMLQSNPKNSSAPYTLLLNLMK